MEKDRLQAFSDGVIAILITIMVLELHDPERSPARARRSSDPLAGFLTYMLSFVNIGIYWNNHHHLLSATRRVNGAVLWANLHLLVLAVAVPVLHGLDGGEPLREAAHGRVRRACCSMAGVAYYILKTAIIAAQGDDSTLADSAGQRREGQDLADDLPGRGAARVRQSLDRDRVCTSSVALMWLVPDRRIESRFGSAWAVGSADPAEPYPGRRPGNAVRFLKDALHGSDTRTETVVKGKASGVAAGRTSAHRATCIIESTGPRVRSLTGRQCVARQEVRRAEPDDVHRHRGAGRDLGS